MKSLVLFLCVLFSSRLNIAFAQAEEEEEAETFETTTERKSPYTFRDVREPHILLEDIKAPHSKVVTSSKILCAHPNNVIKPGDVISLLVGFENLASSNLMITDVVASLTSAMDMTQFLRNYSSLRPNITAQPHALHTLEYRFEIDDRINPNDYGLVLAVFYHDSLDNEYTSVPFNTTITISEPTGGLSARTFLILLALLIGGVVLAVYRRQPLIAWYKRTLENIRQRRFKAIFTFRKKEVKKPVRSITGDIKRDREIRREKKAQDEWLAGTNMMSYVKKARKARAVSRSPSRPVAGNKPRGRSPMKR